jgi:colanic acid/amylovoran biosynthesis protein
MHMAILSLCSGTPVLPIAYEFKTLELFRRLGLGDLVSDIEAVGADVFPSLLDRFIAALSERQPALMEAVLEQRSSALGVVERLRALAPGADG